MDRIIYSTPDGGVAIVIPANSVSEALKDVPSDIEYMIVPLDQIPSDRFFRNAWVKGTGRVDIDLPKAKEIGHEVRRRLRAEEFAPYDEVIAKQIPGNDLSAAEQARSDIRLKYSLIQETIDLATTPEQIKAAIDAA